MRLALLRGEGHTLWLCQETNRPAPTRGPRARSSPTSAAGGTVEWTPRGQGREGALRRVVLSSSKSENEKVLPHKTSVSS